jgi:TrmH family RNA methyltransferase
MDACFGKTVGDASFIDERLQRITSRQNAKVKQLRQMFHRAAPNQKGEVAIEGMHLVEEAIRSGLRPRAVFFSESARERAHKLIPQLPSKTETLRLPDEVFSSAVPTETPQGVAASVSVRAFTLADVLRSQPALIVIAAGVQDPGNLGTIARSAEAFGATGLLLAEGTVSPWNWKAVRASAGSMFRLPLVKVELHSAVDELKPRAIRVLATSSHKGASIRDVDWKDPVALVIGNEGLGLPKEVLAKADKTIFIPQSPTVESLNAGIAASIILYEAARQRERP